MNATKITNPLFIGKLGEHINRYVKRVSPIGISYESLYTYFARIIQYGRDKAEFVVCFNDKTPTGFGVWSVLDIPYIGTVLFDHLYVWQKNKTTMDVLLKKFIEFMQTHNCIIFRCVPRNDAMIRYIKSTAPKYNIEILSEQNGSLVGRRIK